MPFLEYHLSFPQHCAGYQLVYTTCEHWTFQVEDAKPPYRISLQPAALQVYLAALQVLVGLVVMFFLSSILFLCSYSFFLIKGIYKYRSDTDYTQPLHQQDIKRHPGCTQPKKKIKKEKTKNKRPRRSDGTLATATI